MSIQITSIYPCQVGKRLKAVASIILDGKLAINDIRIIQTKERLTIVMPSRQDSSGRYHCLVHPTNNAFREELEKVLLEEYNKLNQQEEKQHE